MTTPSRVVTPERRSDDAADTALRPQLLADFVGQQQARANLQVFIDDARKRNEALDHVNAGKLSLALLVDLTSAGPARLFNIAMKGRIAAGYDADFTVVDLKRSETITNKWVASRAGWTPYDGVKVTGWPVGTFVRGRRVMWQGELLTPATGEPVRFLETLKQ